MDRIEKCGTCQFYEKVNDGQSPGLCLRHAPVAVYMVRADMHRGKWPMTLSSEWCGDYKAIPPFLADGSCNCEACRRERAHQGKS